MNTKQANIADIHYLEQKDETVTKYYRKTQRRHYISIMEVPHELRT